MTDLDRLLIEAACIRLMHGYCNRLDERDFEALGALYTPDAIWARGGENPIELRGIAAIKEFAAKRPANMVSRHVCTNTEVTIIDADNATGLCFGIVPRGPKVEGAELAKFAGIQLVCEYRDRFVRTAEGWRIARRDMTRVFDDR